ncbi:unnamed protein product [Boreogadus saida]
MPCLAGLQPGFNRDMEAKGIVLPELSCPTAAEHPRRSCRTDTEAPPPELLDCSQSFGGSPAAPPDSLPGSHMAN